MGATERHGAAERRPAQRKLIHTRDIVCQGYLRNDGLVEVEGRLRDLTGERATLLYHSLPAGGAVHDMRILMSIDQEMLIHQMVAFTDSGATPYCAEANAAYATLQGLRIGAGFKRQVRERVGGILGCTHLTELVNAMGNTAMQTVMALRRHRAREGSFPAREGKVHWIADTCHTYRSDGEAIKMLVKAKAG